MILIDNLLFTPNGKVHRLLTKLAFKIFTPISTFILGQKNIALKMAVQYDVSAVFMEKTKQIMVII